MTREEDLQRMRVEREGVIGRINGLLGKLRLDNPPSFTPYTASIADPTGLLAAAKKAIETGGEVGEVEELEEAIDAFENLQAGAGDYNEESSPVVVMSMSGLRRVESLLSELEQLRAAAVG